MRQGAWSCASHAGLRTLFAQLQLKSQLLPQVAMRGAAPLRQLRALLHCVHSTTWRHTAQM